MALNLKGFLNRIADRPTREIIGELVEYLRTFDGGSGGSSVTIRTNTTSGSAATVSSVSSLGFTKDMLLGPGVSLGDIVAFSGDYAVKADRTDEDLTPKGVVDSMKAGNVYSVLLLGLVYAKITGTCSKNQTLWMSSTPGMATADAPTEGADVKWDCKVGWSEDSSTADASVKLIYFRPMEIVSWL